MYRFKGGGSCVFVGVFLSCYTGWSCAATEMVCTALNEGGGTRMLL